MNQDVFGLQWCREIANREAKEEIGRHVASFVREGDILGVGSGSTSFITLLAIGERCRRDNIAIKAVPTSIEMHLACEALGIPISSDIPVQIDWCFDGADEVDPKNRLIKGRGGAMYRERQIFDVSKKRYVIADKTKTVSCLGENFPVPVEVEWQCARRTNEILSSRNNIDRVSLRQGIAKDGPAITEGGAVIFDITYRLISDTEHEELMQMPGVRGTGIFQGYEFQRILEL